MTNIPEVEERIHENELADGPSNPVAQHVYDGFPKRQSTSGPSLVLGAAAIGLVLVLASIFGLWLVRSVRRLNREVTHLNRQTEQLNQRVQGAEQHVKSLDQRASQAAAAQAAPAQAAKLRPEQVPGQVKQPEATSAAQAQSPLEPEAAAQPPTQAAHKTEENRTQHADELQKLKQSLGQIAETRRTADGVVMTLGEKSLRFDSGKSTIAPQYRAILNRVQVSSPRSRDIPFMYTDIPMTAGQRSTTWNSPPVAPEQFGLRWLRRESIRALSVQRVLANPSCLFAIAMPKRERPIAAWRSALSLRPRYPSSRRPRK